MSLETAWQWARVPAMATACIIAVPFGSALFCSLYYGGFETPKPTVEQMQSEMKKPGGDNLRWTRATDGRLIEYSVRGSMRQNAHLLIHGYAALPNSIPIPESWQACLERLNVRMIDISVPALGFSEVNPGRSIKDWPITDVEQVLAAEGVAKTTKISVWGASFGTLHSMAMAQHFGPQGRLQAFGLRAPFLPLDVSNKLKLRQGQPSLPRTEELQQGTFKAWLIRIMLWMSSFVIGSRLFGGNFARDYPEESATLTQLMDRALFRSQYPYAAMLWMASHDCALEKPGIDIDLIRSCLNKKLIKRAVIWYGEDDEDCPPSHGKWLAETGLRPTITQGNAYHVRAMKGYGHEGACYIELEVFLEKLLG